MPCWLRCCFSINAAGDTPQDLLLGPVSCLNIRMVSPQPTLAQLLAVLGEYLTLDDTDCLSLPPAAYRSSELYALEIEKIFKQAWMCVGRAEYIPNPGDYYAFDVLGDMLIIVRDDDGEIHALSNICRHRFMPLVQDAGNTRRFVCPYHAWTYATDGRLLSAPGMAGAGRFDREQCSLPRYRLEEWFGFLFVNLNEDAPPLAAQMRTLEGYIANYRVAEQKRFFITNPSGTATGSSRPRTRWSTIITWGCTATQCRTICRARIRIPRRRPRICPSPICAAV